MDPDEASTSDFKIFDPMDMNSTDFNSDIYMTKVLKDSRLSELMDTEQMLHKQIQTLDSEMQTLIYENYNKFISATETVKKMSSHFDKMEHELNLLSANMNLITNKSQEIAGNLSGKRDELTKVSTTHFLLNKIQFILELPAKMEQLIKDNKYVETVDDYIKAKKALDSYSHFPSIKSINLECNEMLDQVKSKFYEQLLNEDSQPLEINESIEYLIKLNENPTKLCDKYFEMCNQKLNNSLKVIRVQLEQENNSNIMDILQFIDNVCNSYLENMNECIKFYSEIFLERSKINVNDKEFNQIEEKLKLFVEVRMEDLFDIVLKRFKYERKLPNNVLMFVRALDRFYKRIQRVNKVFTFVDFTEKGLKIIYDSAQDQCGSLYSQLESKFHEELSSMKHDVINDMNKVNSVNSAMNPNSGHKVNPLSEIMIGFETRVCENLKQVLANLDPFIDSDLSFMRQELRDRFVDKCVFEDILLKYLQLILDSSIEFERLSSTMSSLASTTPPALILILSRVCLDFNKSIISYLFQFTEERFNVPTGFRSRLNPVLKKAKEYSQRLLQLFVSNEGQSISMMIRKSVETRDWLATAEPRTVRSVVKRVIEDVTIIDSQVGQLYEEGTRIDRSSDSSRTFSSFTAGRRITNSNVSNTNTNTNANKASKARIGHGSYSVTSYDNSILSNISKMFNEKIDVFTRVEFGRLSIVTGVIKIGLKTFIECVRLCTFSKYGFQQMQVDAWYLQTHLWKFASDEKIIANMIDEMIVSTTKRCIDPTGMERSVIENICGSG